MNDGGTIDLIFSRRDLPSPFARLEDPCLSDHKLLLWPTALRRPPPQYSTVTFRPWSKLNVNAFRSSLSDSILCHPTQWSSHSCDDLAILYDATITAILDRMIPLRTIRRRCRPSDPWYDDECKAAKCNLRRLERSIRRLPPHPEPDAEALFAAWKEGICAYRSMLRRKREAFWISKVETEQSNPRQLWRSLNSLFGRGQLLQTDRYTATDFLDFFNTKLEHARSITATADPPTFSDVSSDCQFSQFTPVSLHDVARAIRSLPDKQSICDALPTRFLKECSDLLVPFISFLFNKSLSLGLVPERWKVSRVTPLLKKGKRNADELSHYRPISNLPVLSKLLERLVTRQFLAHLRAFDLLPAFQSAYREHHSPTTTLLKITTDIFTANDKGEVTLLSSLDLASAFDVVDHPVLLQRLTSSFGVRDTVHEWFSSFLTNRHQFVSYRGVSSSTSTTSCGVPQGSVLGPILFLLFTKDIIPLVLSHGLRVHVFADDIYIYGSCPTNSTTALVANISACMETLQQWLTSNRLVLNTSKTKFMWCATTQRLRSVSQSPLSICGHLFQPVSSMRCLGVVLDPTISFSVHINNVGAMCFNILRNIRSIRRSVTRRALSFLVSALVFSRLEYCAPILCGLSEQNASRLESVINASARVLLFLPRSAPTSTHLRSLDWLPARARLQLHTAITVFKCLHELAPPYLADMFTRLSDLPGRPSLRSSATTSLLMPRTRLSSTAKRSFPPAAARIWNNLPPSVTVKSSLESFKSAARQHFMQQCFT